MQVIYDAAWIHLMWVLSVRTDASSGLHGLGSKEVIFLSHIYCRQWYFSRIMHNESTYYGSVNFSDAIDRTPPFQHCLHMGNLDSDLDYLFIFRRKHRQLPDAQCHINMACNQWLETWDVAIIYTGGTRICVTVQWMSVDCMTLQVLPASVHPLHYFVAKNTHLFNCIWQIMTHEWWIWIVLLIPRWFQTSFSSGRCFCAFEILVALETKTDLGTVCTREVWP